LGSSSLNGCKKTIIEHDTTILKIHDTTTIHDTTLVHDTICHLTLGLIAYYNFNGGTLHDSSGNNNDIVFSNATKTTDRFGNASNAYLFDGSTNYMRVTNSPSLNPSNISMMAIVKVNDFYTGSCSENQILSKGYPYDINGFYQLGFYDFSPACGPPNKSNEHFWGIFGDNSPQGLAPSAGTDTVVIKTGQWYNITFTYDGADAKLYINGELKSAVHITGNFTQNNFDLLIGKHENPPFPYWFNGVIDEIRIYNRALKRAEVLALNDMTK